MLTSLCVKRNRIGLFQYQNQKKIYTIPYIMTNTNGTFWSFFQEVGGSISVRCKLGKECESKCGDNEFIFKLPD